MPTITEDLLKELQNSSDIDSFFRKHEADFINQTPSDYLNELKELRNKSVADIARAAGQTDYVYKVFRGERNATREILIAIALGLELSLDETQLLLRISKFAKLDSRDKRDSIIIYCLTHGCTVFQTDDLLDENNLPTLK